MIHKINKTACQHNYHGSREIRKLLQCTLAGGVLQQTHACAYSGAPISVKRAKRLRPTTVKALSRYLTEQAEPHEAPVTHWPVLHKKLERSSSPMFLAPARTARHRNFPFNAKKAQVWDASLPECATALDLRSELRNATIMCRARTTILRGSKRQSPDSNTMCNREVFRD
eukprot:6187770-Pleurochrysis_carterae.AAC.2